MGTKPGPRLGSSGAHRQSRPGVARAESVGTAPLTDDERDACDEEERLAAEELGLRRPRTLAECPPARVPCPWASCKYSLVASPATVTLGARETWPNHDFAKLDPSMTCALRVIATPKWRDDLADGTGAAMSFQRIGDVTNVTLERASVIVEEALIKLRRHPEAASLLAALQAEPSPGSDHARPSRTRGGVPE